MVATGNWRVKAWACGVSYHVPCMYHASCYCVCASSTQPEHEPPWANLRMILQNATRALRVPSCGQSGQAIRQHVNYGVRTSGPRYHPCGIDGPSNHSMIQAYGSCIGSWEPSSGRTTPAFESAKTRSSSSCVSEVWSLSSDRSRFISLKDCDNGRTPLVRLIGRVQPPSLRHCTKGWSFVFIR